MASTHVQYQATKLGGPFARVTVSTPAPGPTEVLIQVKAIALNPFDYKQLEFGRQVAEWPAVLGVDGAGIITAVGSEVSKFKVGDEVFAALIGSPKAAAYQEVACLSENLVGKKPAGLTFEEVASMPVCYITAVACIATVFKFPMPFLPGAVTDGPRPKSILVLGGSSSVGAAAIQVLRQALPDAVILATSSSKHHAHLQSLGADAAFDQTSVSLVNDIKAATSDGKGVEMMLDAVAGAAAQPNIFDAFDPSGPRLYAEVSTGAAIEPPEGVERHIVFGYALFKVPGGLNAMSALSDLLAQGKYKVPIKVKVIGTGFEAIDAGLQELKAGVSGTKLVVSL